MALVKYNNNSLSAITAVAGLSSGAMTLIKEQTASSSSTISFVDGTSDVTLDNTYPIYLFKFINIHPSGDNTDFQVNFRDGGSSYDATKTSTVFEAYHTEGDEAALGYKGSFDLAQSTAVQKITSNIGNDNDQSGCGELWLFAPSDTTFVKHFLVTTVHYGGDYQEQYYAAGYCNVTAAIDAVQFSMSSGTIDSGTIKLYGIA
jgi:hypothetical protein